MSVRDLVREVQDGGDAKTAKEELYKLLRAELLSRIEGKIPAQLRSRLDAEDVLQAAFLKALKSLDGFQAQDEGSFAAWVYSIAKNLIVDQGRRRSVAAVRFATEEGQPGVRASQIASHRQRPESLIVKRDWINAALARLHAKEAEVIRLRWLQGMTFEEIAETWKKTPGAVQRFYSRAWQRFREVAQESETREK